MEVTFANNSNRIYFNTDGEDGGTIAAADSSGNPLESGASVGHGADVTFTAEPEGGYMVESWTVDGEIYTWPGTDEPYRESTLTLENISADRTVTVWFEQAAQTTVHTGVVDVDGQSSSAATISVTNAGSEPLSPNEDGTYTVRRDTSLIFTAHLTSSDNNTVREWQSSTDGVDWTTIAGSGGQDTLTVYNPEDEHLYIRAVVATAQNFSLSWKVQMSEGELPEEANASLTAVSNGVALTSGSDQPAYVAVDFTLTLNNAYYVVNWSGNVDSDGTTARLESLTADTEVTVTIAKKPTVNIAEDVSGGSVTVKGTVNGVADTVVANGGYVDNGTAITITADPQNGYVVNTINDKSVNSDRTNGSKDLAVENVTADISATATFLAKPTVTIGSAVGGTVTATSTVDGSSVELSTGSYVDFGTEISVTLAPATGYVVDTGAMGVGDLAYTDGSGTTTDNRTYTIDNVQEDQSIEPKWEALETYAVTYSVVDTNGGSEGGTNGTLSASASRKNMEGYSKPSFTSGKKLHEGSVVALTAVPDSGYRVQEWRVNGDVVQTTGGVTELGTSLTLENIAEDTEISVQFVEIGDRITVSAGSGGRITSAMVSGSEQLENIEEGFTLAPNAQVVITAQPDAGYEVASWSVNGVEVPGESALSYTYTAPADGAGAAISVTFQQVEYPVSWGGSNGTVTASGYTGGSAAIRGGTEVTFTAEVGEGYVLTGWTVNGEEVPAEGNNSASLTWVVPNGLAQDPPVNEYEIEAVFGRGSYSVTIGQPAYGTISADRDLSSVMGGTQVTFTAVPQENYILTGWIVNGDTTDSRSLTHTVTIEGETTVSAVFVPSHYAVTYAVSDEKAGTINAEGYESTPASVAYGESITFTAKANPYYFISGWQVDGKPQEGTANQTSFTLTNVTEPHNVTAVFSASISYTVGYQAQANGSLAVTSNGEALTLEPGQTAQVWGGSKLVFTAAPEEGYMVAQWTVNGEEVTRGNMAAYGMTSPYQNTLTVENLTSALTVRVFFEVYNGYLIPENGAGYTITGVVRTPGETYEGAPTNKIRKGGDVTFTVGLNVEGGYANFSKLVINGYDCLTGELVDEETGYENCDSVTATRNSDGSYTVTIQNVNGKITTDIEAHQLVIGELTVPNAFTDNPELDSVEEIQARLEAQITGASDGKVFYDIALKYYDSSNGTWVDVTEGNFPEEGVDVVLPYPTGTDERDTFTIIHMLTTAGQEGETESVTHTNQSDGLHFHVNSLSPFAISWTKYEAPVNPGGGGGTPSEPEEPTWPFTDVTEGDDWFYDAVAYVYENGIMAGTSETIFSPSMKLNRAQAAQLFYNLEGKPAVTGDSTFTDVTSGHWAVDAITWAAQNDIVAGIGGNLYDPDSNVTREQFAVMLYKYARFKGYDLTAAGDLTQFPDAGSISSWAETALSWANGKGLINGNEDGTLAPGGTATRAQAASILANFDQNVAK